MAGGRAARRLRAELAARLEADPAALRRAVDEAARSGRHPRLQAQLRRIAEAGTEQVVEELRGGTANASDEPVRRRRKRRKR